MIQCSDCQKAANGNCGKHLETYLSSVAHPDRPEDVPKTAAEEIREAVAKAVDAERAKMSAVTDAFSALTPRNHIPCGCGKCHLLGETLKALQKAGVRG